MLKLQTKSTYLSKFDQGKLFSALNKLKSGNEETSDESSNEEVSSDDDENPKKGEQHFFIDTDVNSTAVASSTEVNQKKPKRTTDEKSDLSMSLDSGLKNDIPYIDLSVFNTKKQKDGEQKKINRLEKAPHEAVMKKSVIVPGFEKLESAPPYLETLKKIKKRRKAEREKTKGEGWYDLPATEMTDEVKNDLLILKMRNALDPKQFYKRNDLKVLPKYFQVGRVVDSPADYYNSRIPKKQRKQNLVEELLADAEFQKFKKKKAAEVHTARDKTRQAYKSLNREEKKSKKKKKMKESG